MVVPYDDAWPGLFVQESRLLAVVMGSAAIAIHHVGSTSVPGLCAKPVIDVLVEASDLEEVDRLSPEVESLGYVAKGEYGIPGRRYFSRPPGPGLKVHAHTFVAGNPEVRRHIVLRDYLRAHPDVAAEYCTLKTQLARQHAEDRDAYQAAKADFLDRADEAAQRWSG